MVTGRIRRLVPVALAAAAILAGSIAPAATAARAAIPGLTAWRVRGARDLGTLSPQPMTITLALASRNPASLHSLLAHAHPALTPAQFNSRFAPARATIGAIRHWAGTHGLRVGSVAPNRLLVSVSGSSALVARALGLVAFHQFLSPGLGRFFAPSHGAVLPRSFAPTVTAVLGLSSLDKVTLTQPLRPARSAIPLGGGLLRQLGSGAPSLSYPASYGPQGFWSLYNAPATQTGAGQQLAIITEGNLAQPRADLLAFEHRFGLPAVTWNQINVGTPSSDTSGNDEWDLDSQYSTAFAPGVGQLDVYAGPSLADQDILTTINRWVTDDLAKQGSFSAGECELLANVSGFTAGLDAVLAQADAQGQTMFFSSGDTGSQCPAVVGVNGVAAGLPGTNYPASSPYGIGVGGSTVLGSGPTEIAWYGSGGGSSAFEPTPAFQSTTAAGGVVRLALRGVPDVSIDADPESGYQVVVAGTVQTVGGTSAGAPAWQGIWARAQAAHGGTLGFAGPVIYGEPASAFHDITIGGNGLYSALPGYDYVTGRGTPDIAAFVGGA